jgi:S-adenosylmethionine:diacylglycerol 3-amino-3-carboxypropyl transferase
MMNNPPFESDVTYSVQNEDYQSELALLSRLAQDRPLRVCMIASAGENALSLLTQERIASVDAVDLNPAQIHLCELRRTAVAHLSRDEQLRLFGAQSTATRAGDEATRLALYDQLRPHLPADTLSPRWCCFGADGEPSLVAGGCHATADAHGRCAQHNLTASRARPVVSHDCCRFSAVVIRRKQ